MNAPVREILQPPEQQLVLREGLGVHVIARIEVGTDRVLNGLKCRMRPEKPTLVHDSYTELASRRGSLSLSGSAPSEHRTVRSEEFLSRLLRQRGRHFGRLEPSTDFNRLSQAFGEFDARRASSKMRLDRLASVWRQFQIQIIRQKREDLSTLFCRFVRLHFIPFGGLGSERQQARAF